jgi:hypothetical protein
MQAELGQDVILGHGEAESIVDQGGESPLEDLATMLNRKVISRSSSGGGAPTCLPFRNVERLPGGSARSVRAIVTRRHAELDGGAPTSGSRE